MDVLNRVFCFIVWLTWILSKLLVLFWSKYAFLGCNPQSGVARLSLLYWLMFAIPNPGCHIHFDKTSTEQSHAVKSRCVKYPDKAIPDILCYKLCTEIVRKQTHCITVVLCHASFLQLAISTVSLWQIVSVTCFWQQHFTHFLLPDDPCRILFLSTEDLRQHTSAKDSYVATRA